MQRALYMIGLLFSLAATARGSESPAQRTSTSDDSVVTLERIVDLRDVEPDRGLWRRIGRWVGGSGEFERIGAPFDLEVDGGDIWMTCVDVRGLVRVDLESMKFRVFGCKDRPVRQAVAVARAGDRWLMTDSEQGVVYRLDGDGLEVWAEEGLVRPTGIVASPDGQRVWVTDTSAHQVVELDAQGREVARIGSRAEGDAGMNFPTFLAFDPARGIVVNDTMNFRIKVFDVSGTLRASFGAEGAGPGAFVRAKGVATVPDGRIVVVDGMLDRVQLFDLHDNSSIAIGHQGESPGSFWSPTGVDVDEDRMFVADTYNHRVQILRLEDVGGSR